MVVIAQVAAVVIYLFPVALVVWLASSRDRTLGQLAIAIPTAVAADLVGTLLLCRVFRLEVAAAVCRALWALGGALWLTRRLRPRGLVPARPIALDRRTIAVLTLVFLGGVALSMNLSRPFAIWDRELHIPVVSALRGQRIPFASAYDPGIGFHYHFTGDVLAAMLQTFSFSVLNASLALSLAHDVMFGLIALTIGLVMLSAGRRPLHVVLLGAAAVLLSGPCVLRFGVGEPYLGYSYYALYIWGFRPHQHIAMLMFVGIAAVLLGRGTRPAGGEARPWETGALATMMAVLSVTDETSAAVIGLCLGIAWLVEPALLAPTRRRGALLLAALAVAFVGTNLLFEASLSLGSPVQRIAAVAPRSPGVQQPPLPLTDLPGWAALIADTVPIWAIFAAFVISWRARDPAQRRPSRGLLAFLGALALVSIVGLTTLEINNAPPESHRFLTAALFMFPLLGVLAFDWWPAGTFGRALVLAALTLGGFSTVLWMSHYRNHPTPERYFQQKGQNLHQSNCRAIAGARFGQSPAVVYVESSVFYSYVGCRPSFVAGFRNSYWTIKLRPTVGVAALRQVDREMVKPDEPLDAICPSGRAKSAVDPVCAYALARSTCLAEGSDFLRCALKPSDRRTILGRP